MLVFAHRGASGYEPENTLVAMDKALDLGAKAIELDVHCVEGELVVFHDRRLEGKSTGTGLIHLTTKAALAQFTVSGQAIPTLWQVLERVSVKSNGLCSVNIELKGVGCVQPFIALYPQLLKQLKYAPEQLLISSFNHPYLAAIKHVFPHAIIAPLLGGIPLDLAKIMTTLNAYSINLDLSFVSQAIVDDAHQRGGKVFVYTVDNPNDIQALKAMGVDGVFSNYPDKAIAATMMPITMDYTGWFE
ncbi:glycerophosphodiester phosphodiesterase [Shewanella sp. SG44-6]|jgi:glycerophosphoryl diester phosphodiesterase|uniref:glycerophosphodiester phosphodiesterase n=1 Tax=Shewanella sp. SG44-6 TaxID=2760959 RepID=UPI00160462DD|nr:glycerophosphodiester phosphodiesterase [Shewanella sp. SG44-6]MBB1387883.1 glycerophosphodiester phosphodiesterase [Shewanella sp. SG44-6]|tara:strand:+ start:6482 stop:7216 length:735 start_codon:yes stop_codon:yes gene_type:complete